MDIASLDFTPVAYAAYLVVSVGMTIWVGRTLVRHGRHFLVDAFAGNAELANAVNHLLAVGFYLINFGYAMRRLAEPAIAHDWAQVFEVFAGKMGGVLLALGVMHFFNLYVISRVRRRALATQAPPPVLPNEILPRVAAAR